MKTSSGRSISTGSSGSLSPKSLKNSSRMSKSNSMLSSTKMRGSSHRKSPIGSILCLTRGIEKILRKYHSLGRVAVARFSRSGTKWMAMFTA